MNNKIVSLVAVIAFLLGGFALIKDKTVYVDQIKERNSEDGRTVGALTGPDIPYQYLCVGGICTYSYQASLATATTTPCRIKSPTATSSLISTDFNISTPTSTAATMALATTTEALQYATTSVIAKFSFIASQPRTFSFPTSTLAAAGTNGNLDGQAMTFAPNTWLVYSASGAVGSPTTNGFTFGGTCQAQFRAVK